MLLFVFVVVVVMAFVVMTQLLLLLFTSAEDVQGIVTGKLALKYSGPQIEAIQSIAKASQDRSVAEFEKVRIVT